MYMCTKLLSKVKDNVVRMWHYFIIMPNWTLSLYQRVNSASEPCNAVWYLVAHPLLYNLWTKWSLSNNSYTQLYFYWKHIFLFQLMQLWKTTIPVVEQGNKLLWECLKWKPLGGHQIFGRGIQLEVWGKRKVFLVLEV